MRDNIIINTISKIYFSIVSLFVFIALLLFIGFITLQNGLFLTEVSVSNIHIKQLYIKWNEKLDVSIYEIEVISTDTKEPKKLDYKNIGEKLKALSQTSHWFNSFVVEKISYKNMSGTFKYNSRDKGFLELSSTQREIKLAISRQNDTLLVSIKKLFDKKADTLLKGTLYIDTKKRELYSDFNITIANELDLTLKAKADTDQLSYTVVSNKKIENYKHTIDLTNLPKEAQYWAYDAIKMSSLTLKKIYGYIDYNKPEDAIKNIYVEAVADKLHYTYNKELDAIHTEETALEFKNGVLYIYPHNAMSYKKDLGESWLKIDFTKKEELLTLHLLFDSILDKNMLAILNAYKIKLPFLQKNGLITTDLTIAVGLRNIGVDAQGTFITKEANFDYLGLNIDVYDAKIVLNNYDVSVKDMKAKYKDIAKALVDISYNASSATGIIDFDFDHIALQGVTLDKKTKPLHAKYHIVNNADFIEVNSSKWQFKGKTLLLDALHIPFSLEKLSLQMPTSFISLEGIGNAFVSGSVNLKEQKAKFDADILKLSYEGIELSQSNTPISIIYDKKLSLISKDAIFFNITGSAYKINGLHIEAQENKISLKHTEVDIGKYIQTKIYANFNTTTKKSHISLSNFTLTDPNTKKVVYKNKKIMLALMHLNDRIKINSQELDGEFTSRNKGWRLKLNSISRITKDSALLKHFHINQGDFTIYKNKNDKYTRFNAHVKYPYKILVKENEPLEDYKIKGKIYKEMLSLNINNNLHVKIKDSVTITMQNSCLNTTELLRAMQDISATSKNSKPLNILLSAKNSSLYINKNRSVLYDRLNMQYYDKILTAQLVYHNAKAGLRLQGDSFHLYGKNFDDKFMNKLFFLSNFKNGKLDFALNGDIDDYKGVIYINKTTITDYKILNNVLAFVNTVPSLVTFQLPGYSTEGIYVDKAYANFQSKNNIFNFTDIFLDSKEIDILGKGVANLNNDNIDVVLNLKTDLGSDLSKVPVVGYILLDGNSVSTTLSIKGKASDPEVKSLIAEDIVVAPLNIIKRTLALPYKLIKDAIDQNSSE